MAEKRVYVDKLFEAGVGGTAGVQPDTILGNDSSGNAVLYDLGTGYSVFPIWAEENGGLTNGNRQYSFGNGATGAINIVLPFDCELFAVSFDSEIGGTGTASINIMKDDAVEFTTKAFAIKDFETYDPVVAFSAGECIGFQTNTETGALTDARVCAWFRIPTSLVDNSSGGGGGIEEAPNDGERYVRQNEAWSLALWQQNANGLDTDQGNVGVDVTLPIHNIQVGEQFNDTQTNPARIQNTEIAQYAGTATNNGTAQIGLYESVPAGFPGDYGARIRYDASTNLLLFTTVEAGVETVAFTFDRATQLATFNGTINVSSNQVKDVADPTDPQDAMTLLYFQQRNDAVKVRNTVTPNLNTGVATFNNFTTTDELASTLGQFTFATNGITPNFTGNVEVQFNIELIGAATRATVGFRWLHNGANGPWVRHTYIRNTSGHTETSANFATTIPVVAGQPIQIQHDNFAGGGTVTSPANGVEFIVKRIS